ASSSPFISSFSWITVSMNDILKVSQENVKLTTIGHVFENPIQIFGASPNLYTTTIDGFLNIDSRVENDNGFSLMEQIYTPRGSSSMLVGSAYKDSLQLTL